MPRLFVLNFRSGLLIGFAVAIAVAAAAIAYERYDTQTLKRTLRRDAVLCGVNTGLPGFSSADEKGNWSGFDVDFCRAIAAAIFDDPTKVKFIPLDANERFTELQKRKVDVLSRTRLGICRAKRITLCISPRSLTTTARDSCCQSRARSRAAWSSTAPRSACSRTRPRS